MKARRTEVTIETDEIWIIRRPAGGLVGMCPECEEQTTMMTPEEAAVLTKLSGQDIICHAECGLIHYATIPGGRVLVCFNSIMRLCGDSGDTKSDHSRRQ